MKDVAIACGVCNGPGGVIHILDVREYLSLERPLRSWVEGSHLYLYGGIAIGIHHHIDSLLLQTFCQMRHEQFRAAIHLRGNRDKRRSDQGDSHSYSFGI